jgi:Lysine methyltransferase
VQSKNVLELGAGCGLVGLAAGVLGARQVLMTDLPYALPNMQVNAMRHAEAYNKAGCELVVCAPLDWHHPPSLQELGVVMNVDSPWIPDLILVADCVWMQELVEPLLSTIQRLTAKSAHPCTQDSAAKQSMIVSTRVLLSYQRRGKSTHEVFWNGLHGDRFQNVRLTDVDVTSVGLSKPDSILLLLMEFMQ